MDFDLTYKIILRCLGGLHLDRKLFISEWTQMPENERQVGKRTIRKKERETNTTSRQKYKKTDQVTDRQKDCEQKWP